MIEIGTNQNIIIFWMIRMEFSCETDSCSEIYDVPICRNFDQREGGQPINLFFI